MLKRKILDNVNEAVNLKREKNVDQNTDGVSPYFQQKTAIKKQNSVISKISDQQLCTLSKILQPAIEEETPQVSDDKVHTTITSESIIDQMLQLTLQLNTVLNNLDLKTYPVEYIYNPIVYAFDPYEKYIQKYCSSTKKLLFIGINPGPFGMCQTGVPFGDPICIKEFVQITGTVNKPDIECPFRPITGFASTKREQSGLRFWTFFQNLCQTSELFFKNAIVLNYCPIAFMKGSGTNVTPAELKNVQVRKRLEEACSEWFLQVIRLLKPQIIIAIGIYMDKKVKDLFKKNNIKDVQVLYMPHPSPRAETVELSESELFYMDKAFFYAKEALMNKEVPVGCVFVYKNDIIALGRNTVNETRNATRHAELNCIDTVLDYCKKNNLEHKSVFSELSTYVTVEPCIMCAAALYDLKVQKIIYGCKNDRFGGKTVFDVGAVLNPVTKLKGGFRSEEAMELLKEFYRGTNPNAPPDKVKVKK